MGAIAEPIGCNLLKKFNRLATRAKKIKKKKEQSFCFFVLSGVLNQKLGRSRMQGTPTALHSDQSAMVLLHTASPACLITRRGRPGE